MKRILLLALLSVACVNAASAQGGPEAAIQHELDAMLEAWNRDDLDAHIAAYADSATWTTATGLLYGKAAIRAALVKGFQREGKLLGDLSFGKSEFRRLSDDVMMTNGSFRVTNLPSGKDINGQSTLLWKRVGGRWLIVHDHSS